MSDTEMRLWAQVEDQTERLPLLTLGEARAVVHLLEIFSREGGESADMASQISGKLARRLPAEDD